jgi:hypothetical protein
MAARTNGLSEANGPPSAPVVAVSRQPITPDNRNGSTSRLTPEMVRALNAPLPREAIKPHPTKEYLSSVKAIYVIERLNQVFGLGGWTYRTALCENPPATDPKKGAMIVMHVVLRVPEFGIRLEQYGGSDNPDRGDAYKGAVTDALSKIGSYLGIAMDVYKGGGPTRVNPRGMQIAPSLKHTPAQQRVVEAKLAPQPAAQLAERTPEEYEYEEVPLPEEERSELEAELAESLAAEKAKRTAAFAAVKSRYKAIGMVQTYGAILGQYGCLEDKGWMDTQEGCEDARACYKAMLADVAKRESGRR